MTVGRWSAWTVILLALPPASAHAEADGHAQVMLAGAIGYLDTNLAPGGMVPLVVEAHVAAGHHDPAPESLQHATSLLAPDPSRPLIGWVRSGHALALAGDHRAEALGPALQASFDGTQFGDARLLLDDVYALRTLAALGLPTPPQAIAWLALQGNGTWSWQVGGEADLDSTGMVMWALRALSADLGPPRPRDDLRNASTDGAAFAAHPGGAANCNSTVWAIRSMWMDGRPVPAATWRWLLSLRQGDGGFAFQPGQASNVLCTAEVAALLGDGLATPGLLGAFPQASSRGASGPWSAPVAVAILGVALLSRTRR